MPEYFKIISTNVLLSSCLISLLYTMEISELSYCGIDFKVKKNGFSDVSYILLHGDEETARMLLSEHIKENKGRAFFIKSKEREVILGPTMVDPNRIFSRSGAKKALKKFKPDWEPKELDKLLTELDIISKNGLKAKMNNICDVNCIDKNIFICLFIVTAI